MTVSSLQKNILKPRTVLVISLIFSVASLNTEHACGNFDSYGVTNPSNENKDVDAFTTTRTFIIQDHTQNNWRIRCCGPIESFSINSRRMANPNTDWIKMLIWRPVSGTASPYTLVYSELFSNIPSQNTYTMPVTQSFTVKPNDLIGYTSPAYILDYDNRNSENPNVWYKDTDPAVGLVANTGDGTWTNHVKATYGIRMDVNANNAPTFTNGGATASVSNSDGSGLSVLTVTVADTDTALSELTTTMATNAQFTYDTNTGIVSTGTITAEHTATETLTFTVTDECGSSTTGTYTVVINNDDPVITNMPGGTSVNITEGATAAQHLFTVACTDTVTTSLGYTYSGTDPFNIRGNQVWYDGTSPLVYNTQAQYSLQIECDDGEKTDIETLVVEVLPNMPPVIDNLQSSTNVSITTNIGTIIFQVLVTNPESTDILDFSIVSVSANPDCPNYVEILDNGFIMTKVLLVNNTYVSCEYDVTVDDGYNTDTSRLTVAFVDFDAPMSCQSLSANITVQENTAIGTSVFTTIISDNDNPPQAKTFNLNAVQPIATSYFDISKINDTQAVISTASNVLDYETLASTTLTLVVHVVDSRMSLYCSLDVYVQNVCEAPAFDSNTYTLIANEGLSGQSLGTPTIAVTDPDTSDTFTYLMDCGAMNGRIAMDATTRQLTYSADYDVDNGVDPTSISCTVTVLDSCGENDTATLTITIQHIDDNTPQFSQTIYSFLRFCPSVGVGTSVGTVTATDADDAPHNTMTLALTASADSPNFHIDATSGEITVVRALNCSTDYDLVVTVTDQDGDTVQVDVQIRVAATTPAPTTTVVYEYRRFWEDPLNYLWFVPVVIILAITLAVLCWTALTCHGKQGCSAVLARLRGGRKISLHRPGKNFKAFGQHVKSVRNHPPSK